MEITIDTKMIALIGNPLSHSLSSKIHNEAITLNNINYIRIPMEIKKEHFNSVINGLRFMNVAGISITKPYKIKIVEYLDEIDGLAEKIGAVNCVVNEKGRLKGYNTDGEGFVKAYQKHSRQRLEETVFFCFGAGGAAKAICSVLAYKGAKKIIIASRTMSKVKELVKDINEKFAPVAEELDMEDTELLKDRICMSDVILNNTGLGMCSSLNETPVSKEYLSPEQLCFDATYNPSKTKFLKDAESIGCKIMNGKEMLVHCGMLGFELYTGKKQSIDAWTKIANRIIKEN